MKGQEDAPFEILIGIIIFVFVLSISTYIFEDYMRYQTEAKLEVELSSLANAIESIGNQAPGSKIKINLDFSVFGWGSVKIKYLTLRKEDNAKRCLKYTGSKSCCVIEVHAMDNWNNDFVIKRKYVKYSGDIKAQVLTPSKEYQCNSFDTCLKMVTFSVEVLKDSSNVVEIIFR